MLIEIIPPKSKMCLFFPHAGGIPQSSHMFKNLIPEDYGLMAVDYASEELENLNYRELCTKVITKLSKHLNKDTILIGSSYGGYISYSIAQLSELLQNIKIRKVVMTSVLDVPSVIDKISREEYFIEYCDGIPTSIFQEVMSLVKRDISILRGIQLLPFKIHGTLTIYNGASDSQCHKEETKDFWNKQAVNGCQYGTYVGGHIPCKQNWEQILLNL
jgi:surfactin synthase thioesterase subunit